MWRCFDYLNSLGLMSKSAEADREKVIQITSWHHKLKVSERLLLQAEITISFLKFIKLKFNRIHFYSREIQKIKMKATLLMFVTLLSYVESA